MPERTVVITAFPYPLIWGEGRGCRLLLLPPYSPDLNPIEETFSKVKALLRQAETRTRETLIEAVGKALDAATPPCQYSLINRDYRNAASRASAAFSCMSGSTCE